MSNFIGHIKNSVLIRIIKNFLELTRGYAIAMTLASCMVIWSFAHYSYYFTWSNFIILIIALCLVHMAGNLFDDYIDVKEKIKEGFSLENITFDTYTPKARLIRNKTFSLRRVEIILLILCLLATAAGIYFTYFAGLKVLLFMISGGILLLYYPFSSKHGTSEMVIGLIYGPLMIMGGNYALTKSFDLNLLILSIAIFFSTLVLLHADNIMDWEFDIKNNKKTLAILSGTKLKAIDMLETIIYISYGIIVFGVIFQILNPFSLYVFLTLPIATKLITSLKEYIDVKDVKFQTKWYWGMFENWEEIKNNNTEFYMFRFYLARNYAFWFAFFIMLGTISGPNAGIFSL